MNVKLLRRIQKHITQEPKRYDQNAWLLRGAEVFSSKLVSNSQDVPACKTVGCIAGWACALSGKNPRNRFSETARRMLRLTPVQAAKLFSPLEAMFDDDSPSEWPQQFVDAYADATTSSGRVRVAVRRIEHFIKTKGKE